MSASWALTWAWLALQPLPAPAPIRLKVPAVRAPFFPEGKADEPFWTRQASRTGAFVDDSGRPARPFAEAHFAWDASGLRIALYAADRDITSGDVFRLTLAPLGAWVTRRTLDLAPDLPPATHPALANAKVGVDLDGSWNDPRDDDEEWVVEIAIPWADLGLVAYAPGTALALTLERRDASAGTTVVTTARWGTASGRGLLVLAPPADP